MLKPIAPFVEYVIDKDYITKFLCINQDKPELECEGKCHLIKQLKKQEERTPVGLTVSMKEYPVGFVKIYSKKAKKQLLALKDKELFFYPSNYTFLYTADIFHPPTCIS